MWLGIGFIMTNIPNSEYILLLSSEDGSSLMIIQEAYSPLNQCLFCPSPIMLQVLRIVCDLPGERGVAGGGADKEENGDSQ